MWDYWIGYYGGRGANRSIVIIMDPTAARQGIGGEEPFQVAVYVPLILIT